MLRTRMALTGMALRVVCQVGASVAATLIATVIFAALPKATIPVDRPAAELTSGGKFAARVAGAETSQGQSTVEQRAALPVMAEAPTQAVALSVVAAAWGDTAKPLSPVSIDKPARSRLRLPLRTEARGSADAGAGNPKRPAEMAVAALGSKPTTGASLEGAGPRAEDGMVPRITSSARFLWSMASSAGGSLLSRIIP